MSENQRITMELTLPELRAIQNILHAASALVSLGKSEVMQNSELSTLEGKINAVIGDTYYMAKRAEYEAGIRESLKSDPAEMQVALSHLERDFPTPPAYKQ